MRTTLSPTMLAAMAARETGEAPIVLLEITHAELATPIRVTSDNVVTNSNGAEYVPYHFTLELPVSSQDRLSGLARLTIDNVDRVIVATIRAISSPPAVTMRIVLASSPDTIEAEWPGFLLVNVHYNALTVSGDLTIENFANEPYPSGSFTPSTTPGVFA